MRIIPSIYSAPLLFGLLQFTGCSVLHHTQLGEVDADAVLNGRKFDINVSNIGFQTSEASGIASLFLNEKQNSILGYAELAVALFQMGPRTGNTVFSDKYANVILKRLKDECPNGEISGLTLIREAKKYPVLAKEIVKITGYCRNK